MTDIEDLVRDAYMALQTRGVIVPDDARVADLLGSARSRRNGRIVAGSGMALAIAAALAIGAGAVANRPEPPATSPPPPTTTEPTPAPSASADGGVTYVTSMQGITPADPATLGAQVSSAGAGVPELYPLTEEVLAQAGPGWGYAVFGGRSCDIEQGSSAGVLALVSPDGKAFDAGAIPLDACNVAPVDETGNLVLLFAGQSDTNQDVYVANVLSGDISAVESGAAEALVPEFVLGDGAGLVVFWIAGERPALIAIDPDGGRRPIEVPGFKVSTEYYWGSSRESLIFAVRDDTDIPLWGSEWYAMGPNDEAPTRTHITVPGGVSPPDDCEDVTNAPEGPIFGCEFDETGEPSVYYVVHADGTVEETDPPAPPYAIATYDDIAPGDTGDLNARVTFDWGGGPAEVLDASVLDPASAGPWEQFSDVGVDTVSIADTTLGIDVFVVQPDGSYGRVVSIAQPQGTHVIPQVADASAGRWLWWGAQ